MFNDTQLLLFTVKWINIMTWFSCEYTSVCVCKKKAEKQAELWSYLKML